MERIKGFTLVELLVVMSIIAVLMGMALVSVRGSRLVARDSQRKTELEEIRSALEVYRSDNGVYPDVSGFAEVALTELINPSPPGSAGYLGEIPLDPIDPTYRYRYFTADNGVTYALCAYLEAGDEAVSGCGGGTNNCGTGDCNYKVTNP